jgi:serine/threonine-protein kinase
MAAALFLALLCTSAGAQASREEKAAAHAAFQAGHELLRAGRHAEACPKLEESQRLDPQLGTLLNVAECYAHTGRTASAWVAFSEAGATAARLRDPRAEKIRKRAAELEPGLSRLVIQVEAPVAGLEIRRNGQLVREPLWRTALPVDPGEHLVEASAPEHVSWQDKIAVAADAPTTSVVVPPLAPVPPPAPPPIAPPASPPAPAPIAPPAPETEPVTPADPTGQIVAGIVVGGLGLAGVATGAAFAVIAKDRNDESLLHCQKQDETICDPAGVELRDEARTAQTVAIVSFAAGGAAVVGGAVILITALLTDTEAAPEAPAQAAVHWLDGGALVELGRRW